MLLRLATRSLDEREACCTTATRSSPVLSDGGVRNDYTVRFLNKRGAEQTFALTIDGLPQADVEVVGARAERRRRAGRHASGPTRRARCAC